MSKMRFRLAFLAITFFSIIHTLNSSKSIRLGKTDNLSIEIYINGSYSIMINNRPWLNSSDTFLQANGQLHTNADESLYLNSTHAQSGYDPLGAWTSIDFVYTLNPKFSDFKTQINLSIISYDDYPLIRFRQILPNGVNKSFTNYNSVSSSFPSFLVQNIDGEDQMGYLNFGGMMSGDMEKKMGKWNSLTSWLNDGMQGGPLVLFNGQGPTLVLSSMSQFMSTSMQHIRLPYNSLHFGFMGGIDSLPNEYFLDFMLYYSASGINSALKGWGDSLRKFYNKNDTQLKSDFTNNYLGYWTDNGAYYYWLTEVEKSYEETMLDVVSSFNSIPYRYLQYDSWWYGGPLGIRGGCSNWSSPSNVFPNGPEYIFNRTQLPVSAHNKYWDEQVVYASDYNFVQDSFTQKSLPDDAKFWFDLFRNASRWGLITYEQDWLNHQTLDFTPLLTSADLGRRWLLQMGHAATRFNMTIQYCMSLSRHVLQSVEIPSVTQVRVTNDYATNWQYGGEQWRIGVSSLLAYSLGLAPFKDVYWSTENQPGNRYGSHAKEMYPYLESAISTLSAGPVGPGDKIGLMNESVIMRCCAADGLILKPSKAITSIDDQIYAQAFLLKNSPYGEVWTTYSHISNITFGILLAIDLKNTLKFSCATLTCGFTANGSMAFWRDNTKNVSIFDDNGFDLTKDCTKKDFCLYHISPIFTINSYQVIFKGETSKWVPVSPQRIQNIVITNESLIIYVRGVSHEQVTFEFYSNESIQEVTCVFEMNRSVNKITWLSPSQINCN